MSFTSDWRDVSIAAVSRGISVCGDFLAATALALVLQQRGHGGLAVSGLLIAAALPIAVLGPLAGRLVDRADSRALLVIAGLVQAAIAGALAFTTQPLVMIGLVALLACGLAVTQPTLAALTPAMVRPEDLPKASGIGQTASSIGGLIAPALAGFLVGQAGARPALLLDAVSYLAIAAAGLLLRTRRRGGHSAETRAVSWRVRDDRTLTTLFTALFAVILGVGAINVFEIFFIRDTLGGSTTMYGVIASTWTIGALAGAAVCAKLPGRWFTARTGILTLAGTCVPILAAATVGSVWWIVPLWIVGGAFNGALNVMAAVIVANRVAPESRGRAYGLMNAVAQGASMLGFMVAGPLADHVAPRLLVAGSGLAGLLAAAACIALVGGKAEAPTSGNVEAPGGGNVEALGSGNVEAPTVVGDGASAGANDDAPIGEVPARAGDAGSVGEGEPVSEGGKVLVSNGAVGPDLGRDESHPRATSVPATARASVEA